MKILLVEDSRTIRRENESALRHAGYEVVTAEDGESALDAAHKHKPDLILLDMILPKLTGPEVLRRLKHEPDTAPIPVVVLSSLSERNREKLMEEGAEEYLNKSELMPAPGVNCLAAALESVISPRMNSRQKVLAFRKGM